ncbi:hypothetical protein [Absidia glauca]|uniref:F-box domain-containing protein n=1 Tax=Absidia glauca TaxID=4829 RepID=A0A163KRG3_ABSGL|nr:hypothetical protein [Absidia glauca]
MSDINNLSLELVEHIMDYIDCIADLYQCATVSKYFYMASTPKLWYSPTAQRKSHKGHSVNAMILRTLYSRRGRKHYNFLEAIIEYPHYGRLWPRKDVLPQRRAPLVPLSHCIRKLQFSMRDNVRIIVSLVEQTPLVEELSIKDHVIDSATMDYIAQLCPHLTRIHLHASIDGSGHLASFAQHCTQLRHIALTWPTGLVLESLADFKDHRLESLEINNGYRLIPPLENLESFLSSLQNLTSLKVENSEDIWGQDFMRAFSPTTTRTAPLPLLTSLTITKLFQLGDDFMVPFIAAHPRLESVVLVGCRIGDATLYAIATHLSRLRHLVIDHDAELSPQVIKHVVDYCPVLDKVLYTRTETQRRRTRHVRPR